MARRASNVGSTIEQTDRYCRAPLRARLCGPEKRRERRCPCCAWRGLRPPAMSAAARSSCAHQWAAKRCRPVAYRPRNSCIRPHIGRALPLPWAFGRNRQASESRASQQLKSPVDQWRLRYFSCAIAAGRGGASGRAEIINKRRHHRKSCASAHARATDMV